MSDASEDAAAQQVHFEHGGQCAACHQPWPCAVQRAVEPANKCLSDTIEEGGPLTPNALRAVAEWLDTYDRMAEVFFDILARSGKHIPEEIDQTITGKGIQNDLRRWADELEQFGRERHSP